MTEINTSDTVDTVSVNENALKDAVAVVASLRKNDTESAGMLLGFYERDAKAQAALCGALAAFAVACLATIDNVRDHVLVSDGAMLPSGSDVLKTVMLKFGESQ